MNLLNTIIVFIVSVAVLLFSTNTFVKLSVKLSRFFKISPLIVGSTIVALSTSLPELTVSMTAVYKHDPGFALGNIVGSNITNVLLVLMVAIFLGNLRIGTVKTQRGIGILSLYTLVFIFTIIIFPNVFAGIVLIIGAFIYSFLEYKWGIEGRQKEDKKTVAKQPDEKFSALDLLVLIGSLLAVFAGGYFSATSIERISILTHISTTILGMSITAIATSLPELLTTIFSQHDHEEKVSIGDLIGSNVYNLFFIGGLILVFNRTTISFNPANWIILVISQIIFTVIVIMGKGKTIDRKISFALAVLFVAYLFFIHL